MMSFKLIFRFGKGASTFTDIFFVSFNIKFPKHRKLTVFSFFYIEWTVWTVSLLVLL